MVDVGVGNLRSVERALHAASERVPEPLRPIVRMTNDPGVVRDADLVVMPGQGAFGDCATALGRDGGALTQALRDHIAADRPYLGICLGLQVLFEGSDEAPGRAGLGVFPGTVRRFREGLTAPDGARVKIPHMGWNRVSAQGDGARRIPDGGWFYFVHSYFVVPDDPGVVAATSEHGEPFVCAVAKGALLGVQFHPEKSQRAGLELLRRFLTEAPCK